MTRYQKLDCVKGLLMGMDKQLDDLYKKKMDASIEKQLEKVVVDKYYEAVQELLDEGEPTNDPEKEEEFVEVIINGEWYSVPFSGIGYDYVVAKAGFDNSKVLTVIYNSDTVNGSLNFEEKTVRVTPESNMIFNVSNTTGA